MRFDHIQSLSLSCLVFAVLFVVGFNLSERKYLGGDEVYTQQTAIDAHSFLDLVTLKFPDGNKNPLFYLGQKALCDLTGSRLPPDFPKIFYKRNRDPRLQVMLRVPANIYMCLALAAMVYFFSRFYSVWAGLYALSAALVTPMVWDYWVEARPYGLWFLLTTLQLLVLCRMAMAPEAKMRRYLLTCHILLAFTTPASIFQISIGAWFAWWKGRYGLKQAAWLWALPMAIALFYYVFANVLSVKTYGFDVAKIRTYDFTSNFLDVAMPERCCVAMIYGAIAWILPEKYRKMSWNVFFLPVFALFCAAAIFLLWRDLYTQHSNQGFFSRYVIFVSPADIVMFCLASIDLRRWSRPYPWVCMNVSIVLGGLVILRALMTYRDILASALYLNTPG